MNKYYFNFSTARFKISVEFLLQVCGILCNPDSYKI